ncbi:GNAT family N-acetyltransferase [Clostridium perfringens]|nr:GNAT family N-acetyltransferase [Clostridium perfringens]
MIYELSINERHKISKMFDKIEYTMIQSYIEGYMGRAWVDNVENPTVAQILVGVFIFFAGDYNKTEAYELIKNIPDEALIIVEDKGWEKLIEKIHKGYVNKVKRYSFERELKNLNTDKLRKNIELVPEGYELRKIDEEIAYSQSLQALTVDFTSQFDSIKDYLQNGIGYCIIHNGKVVSGASSYNVYHNGIEIEIDTLAGYRRRGLAKSVASALILYCIENNIYPNWDAANLESVALAEKLGYVMKKGYNAYYVEYII